MNWALKITITQWLIFAAVVGIILYNNTNKAEETCKQTFAKPQQEPWR